VFGIGTGRCGTVSLSKFLAGQHFSVVTHEFRGDGSREHADKALWPVWEPRPPHTVESVSPTLSLVDNATLNIPVLLHSAEANGLVRGG
jgi:hypothetical protein